ncbi:MAG: elongation factor P [Bacteroidia bacterium]
MASTAEFRNGLCLKFNNDIYQVVEFLHVKPGKGAAFVRTKLKSMTNGRVLENTFPAGAKIEPVRVETHELQFLYKDDMGFNFMNSESFEQFSVEEHKINAPQFLQEGAICLALVNTEDESILGLELPNSVEMEVTYTEPGLRGDTASGSALKPAVVDNGPSVNVPLFVNQGDRIKIDTRTGDYIERVK